MKTGAIFPRQQTFLSCFLPPHYVSSAVNMFSLDLSYLRKILKQSSPNCLKKISNQTTTQAELPPKTDLVRINL